MEFSLISWQNAVICAVYFAAGIIDSICGGGGLMTVPTLMLLGVPTHYITGTNQCTTVPGYVVSIWKFAKNGKMHFRAGITAALTSVIGGIIGAKLNMLIPEKYLQIVMIALIPLIALMLLLKKDFGEADRSDTISLSGIIVYSCIVGFACGAYQGFYGPGAGLLYILAFTAFIKLDLLRASGTTKLASFFAAVSSSITYAFSGLVVWLIAIPGMLFYSTGSYIGASLALKKGTKIIRPLLFGVIALLLVKLIIDM